MRKKKNKFDVVMKSLSDGMTISDTAKKFNVSRATIYAWKMEMQKIKEKEKETEARESKLKEIPEKVLNEKETLRMMVVDLKKEIVDKQFKIDMLLSLLTISFGDGHDVTRTISIEELKNDPSMVHWDSKN